MSPEPVKVLTIAGSDSGGAGGLQADLKTMTVLGAHGMSVVTVVTAQNSAAVRGAHFLPPAFIEQQIDAVLTDYGAAAVKTGFLGQPAIIAAVAGRLGSGRMAAGDSIGRRWQVIDPVLVNHQGKAMFDEATTAAYRELLLPLATIVTPNRAEAALLTNRPVHTVAQMRSAAADLLALGAGHVLITGGRDGDDIVDVSAGPDGTVVLRSPRLETENTHGSGDTLTAALAVFLAQGRPLPQALHDARAFTRRAIAAAVSWRLGAGHGPLAHAAAVQSPKNGGHRTE